MSREFRRFPRGRLNAEDEGEIQIAVGVQGDVVVLAFPKLVSWIGMPVEQAIEVAETILKRAQDARRNRQ